jgi:hypothetical protein
LIAVEKYQQKGIPHVQFATEDAKALKQLLIDHLNVPEENISLWIDADATQNRLSNDLAYTIRQLRPEDRFIFFYAGHGFFSNGSNHLTMWDSHRNNFIGTTTCMRLQA